jgi:hypothetical protein
MTKETEVTYKGITYEVSYEKDGGDIDVCSVWYKGVDITDLLDSLNIDFAHFGELVDDFETCERYDNYKMNRYND